MGEWPGKTLDLMKKICYNHQNYKTVTVPVMTCMTFLHLCHAAAEGEWGWKLKWLEGMGGPTLLDKTHVLQ